MTTGMPTTATMIMTVLFLRFLLLPLGILAFGTRPPVVMWTRSSSQCSSFLSSCHPDWLGARVDKNKNTRLNMMFDQLSAAIVNVAQALGPRKKMTEEAIQPALRDVRRALLDADVNLEVATTVINGVKKRSLGTDVLKGVTAEQQFIKAMYDELLDIMGGDSTTTTSQPGMSNKGPAATLATGTSQNPAIILLAGLQGAGKTTAAGKLAKYLQEREVDYDAVALLPLDQQQQLESRLPKRQRKVLLVAADVYRPAAIIQLQILGQRINVTVYAEEDSNDPVDIAQNGIARARELGYDTVIIDTAGRQVIDAELMTELQQLKKTTKAAETLLVIDAMTGQEAATLTAAFDAAVGLTGAILTKLDGDSRGGAAVSVRGVSGRPIKFVGVGEGMDDLEPFYPDRMASRILGMGDVVSLVEKAAALASEEEAARLTKKMLSSTFDFDDYLKQSDMVAGMGSIAKVVKLLPGMGGNLLDNKQIREVEKRMARDRLLIQCMTPEERANPDLLINDPQARQRLLRITAEANLPVGDGQQFVREFKRMRVMMAQMAQKADLEKQMRGGGGAGVDMLDAEQLDMPSFGNRASRRKAKKKKSRNDGSKDARGFGGGGGFG